MLRRTLTVLPLTLLCSIVTLLLNLTFTSTTYAFSHTAPKPTLILNRLQGPLGVTLTLKGQNFAPGQAGLSYIDSQNVPGAFVIPSDSSVQVQHDGTFITTNLIMPANGPSGTWKIVVTDSSRIPWSVPYLVLAAPGQPIADTPSLALSPTTGTGGDVITFTGNNWLPAGTAVQLTLLLSTTSMPLLTSPSISDANGMIAGTFRLPASLKQLQITVSATDIATNTLHARVPILLIAASPTPSASPNSRTNDGTHPWRYSLANIVCAWWQKQFRWTASLPGSQHLGTCVADRGRRVRCSCRHVDPFPHPLG